ncbi:MAG: hypothetical protein V3R99_14230 [Thermoguttaceae bacterium]
MISLWAFVTESDVEAFAAGLVLPPYLAHLRLRPFEFSAQAENCNGEEPLKLVYVGDGRLEEYLLHPADHVLPLIRFICPNLRDSRLHLPRDDAQWSWAQSGGDTTTQAPGPMRVFFAPAAQMLPCRRPKTPVQDAYVSVSRGHVFVGRAVVEAYVESWLDFLGADATEISFDFSTANSEIGFSTDKMGGQVFFGDDALANDLVRFAGLDTPLQEVGRLANVEILQSGDVLEDGIYLPLPPRDGSDASE